MVFHEEDNFTELQHNSKSQYSADMKYEGEFSC